MSYDIYFCRNEPTELHFDEVVSWSRRYPQFREEGESQLIYENPDTGVYFLLEWSAPTEGQESSIPSGVYDTGLSLNLNYARPTFFALEAMPIVEALAAHFRVTMFDPQREPSVGIFSSEQLVESWSKSNQGAVESLAKGNDTFFRLSPDTSTRFWTYMNGDYPRLKQELEGPDVFVPKLFLISHKDSKKTETAIAWTLGIHLVVPRTDWIVVVFPKSFWRRETEMLFFRSDTVLAPMAPYLREFEAGRDLRILPPENLTRADKILKGLQRGLGKAGFQTLSPDRCVDTPLG
jgi:hypothetical protein